MPFLCPLIGMFTPFSLVSMVRMASFDAKMASKRMKLPSYLSVSPSFLHLQVTVCSFSLSIGSEHKAINFPSIKTDNLLLNIVDMLDSTSSLSSFPPLFCPSHSCLLVCLFQWMTAWKRSKAKMTIMERKSNIYTTLSLPLCLDHGQRNSLHS